ncbi:hypothetical protein GCM10012288_11110 [Malaciobacter pacificus]|jgi:hypothetical protein|uniref:Uncharacterized protein n=1 Tax=Malaciobacter pacificus TaxID=1080223 RepID=A0A5C2HE21_9BACT|nr:hypothetical protein [Malaciobacter pacificus]QEP35416.1 hypothetical protein APAC_2356 [Malaciobacter pacificus]GGD38866.1 hypothetical protein GCM10012288_11110 [Malaciobacter pacificus]
MFYLKILFFILLINSFTACTSKELKKYGGEIAFSGKGDPIAAGVGLVIGGTMYGIGALTQTTEDEEENKK